MNVIVARPAATPGPALGHMVAIASGKGGVGKTWLSVTLSRALVQAGRRVLLLDGDLGLANVDIQLGLLPEHDLSALLAGRLTVAQCATFYPPGGFAVLPGRSGSGALAGLEAGALDDLLQAVTAETAYDQVLLDLGAGLERPVRQMAARADTVLVVATEEPTSLTDAYAVLKLAETDRPGGDVRIVVNQASSYPAGQRTYATLARASATFLQREPPLAGIVRRDDRVRDAIRRQTLLQTRHPNSAAAEDVASLAARLLT